MRGNARRNQGKNNAGKRGNFFHFDNPPLNDTPQTPGMHELFFENNDNQAMVAVVTECYSNLWRNSCVRERKKIPARIADDPARGYDCEPIAERVGKSGQDVAHLL